MSLKSKPVMMGFWQGWSGGEVRFDSDLAGEEYQQKQQKDFVQHFIIEFAKYMLYIYDPASLFLQFLNLIHINKRMSESDKNSIKLEEENEQDPPEGHDEDNDIEQDNDQNEDEQAASANVAEGTSQQIIKKRSHKKLEISNFIMKTYKILQDKRNSNIVEWTDEGNCFIVKDKEKFMKQILPKYFKHSKFSSFVRQLNMYDFHKIRKEKQIPIFKHKYFQEGRIDLLHKIKRKSGEDGKEDEIASKEAINFSEPNVDSRVQISYSSIKQNPSVVPSTKSEIDLLRKENLDIQQSIIDICQEIQFLEMSKEKKKQKLVKVITSIMFFDLNSGLQENELKQQDGKFLVESLRSLQQHFVKDEEPLSFTEYRKKLSGIYSSLKNNLLI